MGHPDALVAMLSGKSEITGHFCVAPFHYYELAAPGLRAVLKSYDTLGGPHTNGVQVTTETFRRDNPKICQAVFASHDKLRCQDAAPAVGADTKTVLGQS